MRILLFLFFAVGHCFAQSPDVQRNPVPRHAIKISPFHLLGFYPTIQLAYERHVIGQLTLQVDAGYVLDFPVDDQYKDKHGFKVKLEPRIYLKTPKLRRSAFYGAVEGYYNAVDFLKATSVVECFDLTCLNQYRRRYDYEVNYRESGVGLKSGFAWYARNIMFDVNWGVAVRFIDYDKPPGVPDTSQPGDIPYEADRTAYMPLVGIRVGYRIR